VNGQVQYSYFYDDGRKNQPYLKTEIRLGEFRKKAAFDAKVNTIKVRLNIHSFFWYQTILFIIHPG